MTCPPAFSLGLVLLLMGYAAAAPEPDLRFQPAHPSACQEHVSLHGRLDVVEKKVEATIDTLEAEIGVLLDAIEAPEWRPLLEITGRPTVDILDDPEQRGHS